MKLNKNFVFGVIAALVLTLLLVEGGGADTYHAWSVFIGLALVCYPWKFGKNVYSLFGGFNNEGSVYSLFGIVQHTSGSAVSIAGLSIYQYAERTAFQVVGLSIYQFSAGTDSSRGAACGQLLGLSLWMKSRAANPGQVFGVACYMDCEEADAFQLLGATIFQRGEKAYQVVGMCGFQISTVGEIDNKQSGEAQQNLGVVLYQSAKCRAFQGAGLRLFANGSVKRGSFLSITIAQKEPIPPVVSAV